MMSLNHQQKAGSRQAPVIYMTGGGSGGHLIPILSLAHELKRLAPDCQLIYIGQRREKISQLAEQFKVFDKYYKISAGKLRRFHGRGLIAHLLDFKTLLLNARDSFKVLAGTIQAYRLVRRDRPDAVFSKGSYVAVPVGIAAHLAGRPIVTHDSDATPGLANRIVGRWATVHATALDANFYPYSPDSVVPVGVPIKADLKPVTETEQSKAKKDLGLATDSRLLLIGGAGLGSDTLNQLTIDAAEPLLKKYPDLSIVQLTGDKHLAKVQAAYRQFDSELAKRLQLKAFTNDFLRYSAAADVIVSRAGATAIAEFAAQAKATIIIPAPWLPGGQQLKNAKILRDAKAAIVLDNDVSSAEFLVAVEELLSSPGDRQNLSNNIAKLAKPDATRQLAQLILKTATAGHEL